MKKDKVGKYDPYVYNTHSEVPYRCPYLIIQPKRDRFVSYDIAVQFADIMNKKGSEIIVIDTDEVGDTMLYPSRLLLVVIVIWGKNYPLNKTVDDMYFVLQVSEENRCRVMRVHIGLF